MLWAGPHLASVAAVWQWRSIRTCSVRSDRSSSHTCTAAATGVGQREGGHIGPVHSDGLSPNKTGLITSDYLKCDPWPCLGPFDAF